MSIIHLANTDFEFELAQNSPSSCSISESWTRHPLCLQLQFLPLLYAEPEDVIAVTAFPSESFLHDFYCTEWRQRTALPRLALIDEKIPFQGLSCHSWGPSKRVLCWAQDRLVTYSVPTDWEMVREVNSKAYSFRYHVLNEACLLTNPEELFAWLKRIPGKKVLKKCFGFSGKGNRLVESGTPPEKLLAFCEKEWQEGRPLVGEPWLDRCFDFSTQWLLHKDGKSQLLGSTVFENDSQGAYLGTLAGSEESLFGSFISFLEQHKEAVQPLLRDLLKKGFFGNLGIDALLYRQKENNLISLYPIVELNARQTMSLAALRMHQKWFSKKILRLEFVSLQDPRPSLLPDYLLTSPKKIFKRKLTFSSKDTALFP